MSLMKNGVTQWKFQRFANLVCILGAIALVGALFCGSVSSHEELKALFSPLWVKLMFAFMLLLACMNSILAGWQIAGDYAAKIKLPASLITGVISLISVAYLLYGSKLLFL